MQKLSTHALFISPFFRISIAEQDFFRSIVRGSDHDDTFDLKCGLGGPMILSVKNYPLSGDRIAFFDGFLAGNCTAENGGIVVSQTNTSYSLSIGENCGTVDSSDQDEVSASVGLSMHGYTESEDGGFKFYQTTVNLKAACTFKTKYVIEYRFDNIDAEEPEEDLQCYQK